jgi:hypothetical protein
MWSFFSQYLMFFLLYSVHVSIKLDVKGVNIMFRSYSGLSGLLILLVFLFLFIMVIFSIGGFLLGTPVGLAILGVLVLRHLFLRNLRIRAQQGNPQQPSGMSWRQQSSGWQDDQSEEDGGPGSVTESGIDRSEYSSAEDVNFKELQ